MLAIKGLLPAARSATAMWADADAQAVLVRLLQNISECLLQNVSKCLKIYQVCGGEHVREHFGSLLVRGWQLLGDSDKLRLDCDSATNLLNIDLQVCISDCL